MRLSAPIAIAMTLALAGCTYIPGTEAHKETLARRYLSATLSDPASALFMDLRGPRQVGVDRLLCGRVNSKNVFGGYVGYRRFVVDDKVGTVITEPADPDPEFDRLWDSCEKLA